MKDFQITGGPAWVNSEQFDVIAKAPASGDVSGPELDQMIQSMLRERFRLEIHRETKRHADLFTGNREVWSETHPHHHDAADLEQRNGSLVGTKVPMDMLAGDLLESQLRRVVVDHTGIPGEFDIKLTWTPDNAKEAGVSLFTAIQEQIGLRLE